MERLRHINVVGFLGPNIWLKKPRGWRTKNYFRVLYGVADTDFNFVAGMHWTGLPNRNTDLIGQKVQQMSKIVFAGALDNLRTIFGHFADRGFRHSVMILNFSRLSNNLPVTTLIVGN